MSDQSIGILEKRRAQAEVIKPIYEAMKEEFGTDAAQRILATAIRRAAIDEGRSYAAAEPMGTSLDSFRSLQTLWFKGDAITLEPVSQSATEYSYNVTRCRYAEMYREMGLAEIGHLLSCNRDASFCEGYHPRLRLLRTQTLMESASHCDFRFSIDPDEPLTGPPTD